MTPSPNSRKSNPSHSSEDLTQEIRRLRVIIHLVADLARASCPADDLLAVLGALSEASTRLATLLKTQQELTAGHPDSSDDLKQALSQILAKLSPAEINQADLSQDSFVAKEEDSR